MTQPLSWPIDKSKALAVLRPAAFCNPAVHQPPKTASRTHGQSAAKLTKSTTSSHRSVWLKFAMTEPPSSTESVCAALRRAALQQCTKTASVHATTLQLGATPHRRAPAAVELITTCRLTQTTNPTASVLMVQAGLALAVTVAPSTSSGEFVSASSKMCASDVLAIFCDIGCCMAPCCADALQSGVDAQSVM
jgi:hypothetical protein